MAMCWANWQLSALCTEPLAKDWRVPFFALACYGEAPRQALWRLCVWRMSSWRRAWHVFLKWGTANQAGMPYASVDIIWHHIRIILDMHACMVKWARVPSIHAHTKSTHKVWVIRSKIKTHAFPEFPRLIQVAVIRTSFRHDLSAVALVCDAFLIPRRSAMWLL